MLKNIPLLTLSLLALTACIDRGEADAKLARGCAAGVELFLDEEYEIQKIVKSEFRESTTWGNGYREVDLTAMVSDGWHEGEETYYCTFAETAGPILINYKATIYQLRMPDGTIIGKEGDKISGSYDDHLKLTETVEQGMNR